MDKKYLALNNRQWLICHKTQTNLIIYIYIYIKDLALNKLQWLKCPKTKQKKKRPHNQLPVERADIDKAAITIT